MKGDAKKLFVPEDVDEEEVETEDGEGEADGAADALLGEAFDAVKDDDRAGFVRLMKSALAKE